MKTSPLSAMQRSFRDPRAEAVTKYNCDQEFAVQSDGKEKKATLFLMLYSALMCLRLRKPVKVFLAQGPLVFEHDGKALLQYDPVFVPVIQEFEEYLLAERRDGFEEGRLSMRKEFEESELEIRSSDADSTQRPQVLDENADSGAQGTAEDALGTRESREQSGRREIRRRR